MNFTLAELTKIDLLPGDILAVKLYGDDYEETDLDGLREHLQKTFPNNKVAMFVLPNGKDLQFEKLSGNLENKGNSALEDKTLDWKKEFVAAMEAKESSRCADPVSYCNNCGCGKKAMAESMREENESIRKGNADLSGADGTSDDRN